MRARVPGERRRITFKSEDHHHLEFLAHRRRGGRTELGKQLGEMRSMEQDDIKPRSVRKRKENMWMRNFTGLVSRVGKQNRVFSEFVPHHSNILGGFELARCLWRFFDGMCLCFPRTVRTICARRELAQSSHLIKQRCLIISSSSCLFG